MLATSPNDPDPIKRSLWRRISVRPSWVLRLQESTTRVRVGSTLVVVLLPFVLVAFRRVLGETGAPIPVRSLWIVYLGLGAVTLGTRNALRPLYCPPLPRAEQLVPRLLAVATVAIAFVRPHEPGPLEPSRSTALCMVGIVAVAATATGFISLARRGRGPDTERSRDTLAVAGVAALLFAEFFCGVQSGPHLWDSHGYGFAIACLVAAELSRRIPAWAARSEQPG